MKLSPCTLFCSSVLFLFYTGSAFAEMTKLSKLEAYLKKSGKCYFAVGSGGGDGPILADPDIDPRKIYCVADLAFNEGTINEKSGCSLSFLDANSGAFSQTMNEPIIVEGKTCSGGGFEKLLEKTYL